MIRNKTALFMTFKRLSALAALGSAGTLLAAFGFQYIGELPPCEMCLWQRWPHAAAVVIGALTSAFGARVLAYFGALTAATTSAIGFFHAGVEQGWWEGVTACSSTSISGLSADELFDQIMAAPVVRCDEIPWELFGISIAGWNGIISLGLALIWIMAARAKS